MMASETLCQSNLALPPGIAPACRAPTGPPRFARHNPIPQPPATSTTCSPRSPCRQPPHGRSCGRAQRNNRRARIGQRARDTPSEGGADAHAPAQWLREAAIARCLPSPPVAAINREQYAELARLAANLNELTRLANEGGRVTVADELLASMMIETRRLRLALLGVGEASDDS
jgi:hypothetical protein